MTYLLPGTAGYPLRGVTPGFGTLSVPDFQINGKGMTLDVTAAIHDITLESTIGGASTVTMVLKDPTRQILRSQVITFTDTMTVNGLSFTCVEFTKSGDTLTIIFEATGVNMLRRQIGVTASTTTTNITTFVASLVAEVSSLKFVGQPTPTIFPIATARGSSDDPEEDSWTCMQRLAGTAGWRCWEYNTTIYFGSDLYWAHNASSATFAEFEPAVQTGACLNIDFDWDYGQAMAPVTATVLIGSVTYAPGDVITVNTMGPADGIYIVYSMSRDLFNITATVELQWPLTPAQVLTNIANPTRALLEAIASNSASTGTISTSSSGIGLTTSITPTPTKGTPAAGIPVVNVTVSPNPAKVKQSFTVTCTVTGEGHGVTPQGTVTFQRNGRTMTGGTNVKLGKDGKAKLTEKNVLKNAGGNHIICYYSPSATAKWQAANNSANPKVFNVTTT